VYKLQPRVTIATGLFCQQWQKDTSLHTTCWVSI